MSNVHAAERKVNAIFTTFHHAQKMRREIRALCLRRFTYKFKAKSYETSNPKVCNGLAAQYCAAV